MAYYGLQYRVQAQPQPRQPEGHDARLIQNTLRVHIHER